MSRKQSAKDILKSIDQEPEPSTSKLPTSTHRTRMRVKCYCKKCNGKLVDPRTKDQHSLNTSQQLTLDLNELRQSTQMTSMTSELSGLSQSTDDLWADVDELPSSHNELLSSLDIENIIIFTEKTSPNIKC